MGRGFILPSLSALERDVPGLEEGEEGREILKDPRAATPPHDPTMLTAKLQVEGKGGV